MCQPLPGLLQAAPYHRHYNDYHNITGITIPEIRECHNSGLGDSIAVVET